MAHSLTPLILCSQVTFSESPHLCPHCLRPHLSTLLQFSSAHLTPYDHMASSLEGKLFEGRGLPVSSAAQFLVLCMEWTFKHYLFKELAVHGHPSENPILGSQPFSWSTSNSPAPWGPLPNP